MVIKRLSGILMAGAVIASTVAGACPVMAATGVGSGDSNVNSTSLSYEEAVALEGNNEFSDEEDAASSATSQTYVTTSIESSFTVTIPKKVALLKNDEGTYGASYDVTVKDTDIRPDQKVTVAVSDNIDINETTGSNYSKNFKQSAEISTVSTKDDAAMASEVADADSVITYQTQGDLSLEADSEVVTYTLAPQALTSGTWLGTTTFTVSLLDK